VILTRVFSGHIRNDRKNPHVVFNATRADKAEVKRRAAVAIPAFEAVSSRRGWDQNGEDPFPGYPDGVQYASAPRTSYQARAREGIAEDADVDLHYTARFTEGVVERLVTSPDYLIRLWGCDVSLKLALSLSVLMRVYLRQRWEQCV
jgi:hypothetical protein